MTVIIVIGVILFFIWVCSRANRNPDPVRDLMLHKKLIQELSQTLKDDPAMKNFSKPVFSMAEEEKYFEAVDLHKKIRENLAHTNLDEKIKADCEKTGEISDETQYELAKALYMMLRLADLMNIPADKLSENFDEETKKYFFSDNKKKFIFKIVCEEINNTSEEEMAAQLAEAINKDIPNKKIARQFVLEELDAARQGSDEALAFALNSGFMAYEYEGAMLAPKWEDNAEIAALQTSLRSISYQIKDETKRCRVNLLVVDAVMKHWKLGKYA